MRAGAGTQSGSGSRQVDPARGRDPSESFFAAAPSQVRLTARCCCRGAHAAAPGSARCRVGASAAASRPPLSADPIAIGSPRRPGPPGWRRASPSARGGRRRSAGRLRVRLWRCASRGARAGEPDHPEACRRLVLRLATLPPRFQALSTRHSAWVAGGAGAPPVCGGPGAVAGGEPPAQTLGHGSHALPPPQRGPPRRRDTRPACGVARPTLPGALLLTRAPGFAQQWRWARSRRASRRRC